MLLLIYVKGIIEQCLSTIRNVKFVNKNSRLLGQSPNVIPPQQLKRELPPTANTTGRLSLVGSQPRSVTAGALTAKEAITRVDTDTNRGSERTFVVSWVKLATESGKSVVFQKLSNGNTHIFIGNGTPHLSQSATLVPTVTDSLWTWLATVHKS